MSYFIFNGYNSRDLGIIVTKPIIRPTWAPEMEYISIPGRPRQMPKEKTWYPNKPLNIEAVLSDAAPAKVREVYAKLRGYGVLNISTAPDEYLNCYVEELDPNGVAIMMAEFPIRLTVEPFAYSSTLKEYSIANAENIITYNGSVFCDPQIVIQPIAATTSVTCNGKTITINTPQEIIDSNYATTYSITLDCEGQIAYYTRPTGDNVGCTQLTNGQFPRLHEGDNYIEAQTVRDAVIKYRERWC